MRLDVRIGLSCLVLTASVPLYGQLSYNTIEVGINRAEAVYVGRIVSVALAPSFPPDSQQRSVVVAIEQTLKGEPVQQLSFEYSGSQITQWQKSGDRLLIPIAHSDGAPMPIIDLNNVRLWELSENLVVLQTPEEILQAVRMAVQRIPHATPGEMDLWVPPSVSTGPGFPKEEPVMFPVDDRLEQLAHTILSKETGDGYRAEAVQALQFFKSDENIRLLTPLLSHPSDVRTCEEVKRVLTGWGISLPKAVN